MGHQEQGGCQEHECHKYTEGLWQRFHMALESQGARAWLPSLMQNAGPLAALDDVLGLQCARLNLSLSMLSLSAGRSDAGVPRRRLQAS